MGWLRGRVVAGDMPGGSVRMNPTPVETPCREWRGSRLAAGYGLYRRTLLHRWVWEAVNGPIPAGVVVRHRCDNPPCFRYDHLLAGTQADNVADMMAKGRDGHGVTGPIHPASKQGILNGRARLGESDVMAIRARLVAGESATTIALDYGVRPNTIHYIKTGQNWGWLP